MEVTGVALLYHMKNAASQHLFEENLLKAEYLIQNNLSFPG
jgi:hypothetical protein